MGVFSGLTFVLEVPAANKKQIQDSISSNGGKLSFTISRKVNYVVSNEQGYNNITPYKHDIINKFEIPVLSQEFLKDSIFHSKLSSTSKYLLGDNKLVEKKEEIVSSSSEAEPELKIEANLPVVNYQSKEDLFPKEYTILKQHAYKSNSSHAKTELHLAEIGGQKQYRIFSHSLANSTKDCRLTKNIHVAEANYSKVYGELVKKGFTRIPLSSVSHLNLGSDLAKQANTSKLTDSIQQLIHSIFTDANQKICSQLGATITSDGKIETKEGEYITSEKAEEAEGVILQIRQLMAEDPNFNSNAEDAWNEFYDILPFQNKTVIKNVDELAEKLETIQLIKDFLGVNEGLGGNAQVDVWYRALNCDIKEGDKNDFLNIGDFVKQSFSGNKVPKVNNVYIIGRRCESESFEHQVGNSKLLFHGTKGSRLVGILSRGLLLPTVVAGKYGVTRTDEGLLGSGIYFSDSAETSLKYTAPCAYNGMRYLLVSQVVLGKIHSTVSKLSPGTFEAPAGCDSVHAVSKKTNSKSFFNDDEFCVYRTSQQKLEYLVEIVEPGKENTKEIKKLEKQNTTPSSVVVQSSSEFDSTTTSIAPIIDDAKKKSTKCGLFVKNNVPVPLVSTNVKAKVQDMVAEVVIYQEYKSEGSDTVEAKYLFPIDDNAAVCGFEAFINDKHVIGKVKEKEKARKEYAKAVSEGHGAYLVEQEDQGDIWSLSIGNLPPNAVVIIKISYVTELVGENNDVLFVFPSYIAPTIQTNNAPTQFNTQSVSVKENSAVFRLEIGINMPYEITKLFSRTHHSHVQSKNTATKGFVKMELDGGLKSDFTLSIGLLDAHKPRLWVEENKSDGSYAAMMVLYPDFNVGLQKNNEYVIVVDRSASMESSITTTQKCVSLLLDQIQLHQTKHRKSKIRFNIVSFGSIFEHLFPTSTPVSDESIRLARSHSNRLKADYGGTDMWTALNANYLLSPPDSNTNRVLVVLTDGQVNSIFRINIHLASTNSSHTRIFAVGVGGGVSRHSIHTLSRASGGACTFVENSETRSEIQRKMAKMISQSVQSVLTNIEIDWHVREQVDQVPKEISSLFIGERQVYYAFLKSPSTRATLKAKSKTGAEFSFSVSTHEVLSKSSVISKLAAKGLIRNFDEGVLHKDKAQHLALKNTIKPHIVDISTKYGVASKFTSFVAIEERKEGEKASKQADINELLSQENLDEMPCILI